MYDLIVIGGGWAGLSAAEYASKCGLKTALIEAGPLGGTCLNYGCIPTKALTHTAKLFTQVKKSKKLGLNAESITLDFTQTLKRKEDIINRLRASLDFLIKINKIDLFRSNAEIIDPNKVKLDGDSLEAKYILIAAGSKPKELPQIRFNHENILSSTGALSLSSIPAKLLIIGGGIIGCEFAEIFSSFGSKVEIAELTGNLLPGMDKEAAKKLEAVFRKKGIKISLNAEANSFDLNSYDKILLSIGRSPNTGSLGKNLGLFADGGRIPVNEFLQTKISNIYAAGDCIGGYLLAHVASYEGRLAVKNIIEGNKYKANYKAIPSAIFTNPEIASVGLSQEEAIKKYGDVIIKRLDLLALGMCHILDETEGFIKITTDKADNILGAVIAAPKASELIHVITLAINTSLKSSQIKNTIFAHPSVSEGILEALLH